MHINKKFSIVDFVAGMSIWNKEYIKIVLFAQCGDVGYVAVVRKVNQLYKILTINTQVYNFYFKIVIFFCKTSIDDSYSFGRTCVATKWKKAVNSIYKT